MLGIYLGWNCWLYVLLCSSKQFPKWLYQCKNLPRVYEYSSCFISSPLSGKMSIILVGINNSYFLLRFYDIPSSLLSILHVWFFQSSFSIFLIRKLTLKGSKLFVQNHLLPVWELWHSPNSVWLQSICYFHDVILFSTVY